MARRIFWRESARKEFDALERDVRERLSRRMDLLLDEKRRWLRLTGTFSGQFKLRAGDYRVVFEVDTSGDVIIVSVGHRRDIYR